MDILITEKSLRSFLKTPVKIKDIINHLSNSGPTVDRYSKTKNDTVLEIEIITNRIDSASVFGIAKEANAILTQNKISSKLENNPYLHQPATHTNQTATLNFKFEKASHVKRFTAIAIDGLTLKPSPKEVSDLLENTGQRPINNLVDATNEATLLYGIPSHIFDKDKLSLQKLLIREANAQETLTTLDNTKITLNAGDLIIEDGSGRLVDLCGIMGGNLAVVDEHTKNIVLIVPIYNPQKIRKTSLAHQKRTLAAQIYEKGPDPQLALPVLDLLSKTIIKRAGGHISSKVFDTNPPLPKAKTVKIEVSWLNAFTGLCIPEKNIIAILSNLGFLAVKKVGDTFLATVPSSRYEDINTREDLAEEVTRIYGYNNLPSTLPPLNKTPKATNPIFKLETKIRHLLSTEGFNEVYNSSLVSKNLLENTGLNPENHLRLKNCLSEELEYLRTTLVQNSLLNHANNRGKTNLPLKFFELANVYLPTNKNKLPLEVSTLIFSSSLSVLELKTILEKLFSLLNYVSLDFRQPPSQTSEYLDSQNSADILLNDQKIGQIGEIKTSVYRSFNLANTISVVEINISLLNSIKPHLLFSPISEFPELKEDITIHSPKQIGEIIKLIKSVSKEIKQVKFKESFKTNHTFEITIESLTKNLSQKDADLIRTKILNLFL